MRPPPAPGEKPTEKIAVVCSKCRHNDFFDLFPATPEDLATMRDVVIREISAGKFTCKCGGRFFRDVV